jgi:hypothetical protein
VRETTRQERACALALAGVLGVLTLARLLGPLAGTLAPVLANPVSAVGYALPVMACVTGVVTVAVVVRALLVRRTLRSRVAVELLPSEAFDPNVEAVVRFAAQLARTRRMVLGWLDRPASAVRLQLATGTDGLMHYTVEVPQRGSSALRAALGAYDQLDVRPVQ